MSLPRKSELGPLDRPRIVAAPAQLFEPPGQFRERLEAPQPGRLLPGGVEEALHAAGALERWEEGP
jgi:hypothetical protein